MRGCQAEEAKQECRGLRFFKTVVTVGLSGVEMTCSGLKQGVGF